jgi:hypothetical protein
LGENPIAGLAWSNKYIGALDLRELEKVSVLLFLFGFFAPVAGFVLQGRPNGQRLLFLVICFMLPGGVHKPQEWGLTLGSLHDFYRGHATGYHFYFLEAFALAMVIAGALEKWREFRFMPPGLWLYFAHCAMAMISIVNAPSHSFVYMAAFKAVKISVVFVAAYHFFSTPKNVQFFLLSMCAVIAVQLMAVLRQRYLLGIYQVTGTFEHQNSLSMFTTMIGMLFLGVALGPKERWSNLYLAAYIACGVIQQSTFSRAGMVIFAAGSAGVGLFSLVDKLSWRRFVILGLLGVVAAVGLMMSYQTILSRFQDYGNEASGKTRDMLNKASRNMIEDYPLGVGWNNYALLINRPYQYGIIIDEWEREGGATIDPYHQKGISESLYYLVLAETGWQGFISFMLFLGLFLWWNFRAGLAFRYQFLGALSLGIAFGCGANYLHSILERVLVQPRNMMLWFILLAATSRIETWRREKAAAERADMSVQLYERPALPNLAK